MLFRIEDVSGFSPNLREYDANRFSGLSVKKAEVDKCIAAMIGSEVNGAKDRKALSYSKSLAAAILKYNKFTDNELHICGQGEVMDRILYISPKGNLREKPYSIKDRAAGKPLFRKSGEIELRGFMVDVSKNDLLDEYLRKYTGKGRKRYASPEKDQEVVVMNPPRDLIIREYMPSVYTLYALQMNYHFLNEKSIQRGLISELEEMDEFRFESAPQEREAFKILISYLSGEWEKESQISEGIYQYFDETEHVTAYFDPILQFYSILYEPFEEAHDCSSFYNGQVLSELFWEYCAYYLEHFNGIGICKGENAE